MKYQLCAAQLMVTDVLTLDEPTGHVDVANSGGSRSGSSPLRAAYLHLALHSLPEQVVHAHH